MLTVRTRLSYLFRYFARLGIIILETTSRRFVDDIGGNDARHDKLIGSRVKRIQVVEPYQEVVVDCNGRFDYLLPICFSAIVGIAPSSPAN